VSVADVSFDDILLVMVVAVAVPLVLIVVAAQIGVAVHALRPINAASLVAAGMLSVLLFPALALRLLPRATGEPHEVVEPDERAVEGM
jgi:hypothetical protein